DWSGSNTVTTSNNLYFDSAHILGSVLSDTVNGFIAPGSPLIDAGFTIPTITTDFAGIPRPQGTAYDIGAREYSASASFAIANAGNNNTITLPSSSVTLNGSTSYAINSTLTYYLWTEISGPNTAVLSKPDSSITQVTGLILGTYVFSLKVKDANNDSSYATVSITVNAANLPPVVNAGINQTITLPTSTVTLSGSATDATGVIISHIWSQISGPNTSAIASASSYSTNVSSLIAGTYVFQLQATDNNSLSGTSTVSITVNPAPNQPPVVNAGTSQTIVLPTSTTTLSGSTTDATGTVVSYLWTQQSGPNTAIIGSPTTITTGISGLVAGVYVFQLKATDNNNLSGSGTLTIHVNPAAVQPPVANAGLNQTITLPTNFVSLNGTASYDPAGSIVSYSWSQISGPSSASISGSNSATASGSALVQGVYIFELTVLNNGGASSSAQVTVTVNNVANPIANAGTDQTITLPDNSVSLNGSQSYVPNGGTIASYNWVQTSGSGGITITNATTATPQASGLQVGQYVFQLTVTNSLGISSSAQVTITVLQGNLPPVANAGNDTTIALPTTSITLDGSTSYAPSGSIITYLWSQLQGPNNAVFASVNTPITSVYGLQPGIYKFQLMVTDNNGISVTSTVSDTVIDNLRTSSSASLLLYPNPTSNNLNLQISNDTSGTVLVFVYDMLGNMVMTNQFTKQSSFFSAQINVSSLRSGTYTLQTILGNKSALITKFVKQ
ncbi:MAG: T9SS type A sorting domain-containing protein, partial [Bacteroidetes bacterium]|nr:T9SS type A sorting domain-containing protein [Bacteroidota bacterium]